MKTQVDAIKSDILAALGYSETNPPAHVDDKQASYALGVKPNTLAVWRSTGRYDLPYLKVGRLVKYRVSDLALFLAQRSTNHTGEVA